MKIRLLEEKDWGIFLKWMNEIAEKSFDNLIPSILANKIKSSYEKEPTGFIVIEESQQTIGALWFETCSEKGSVFIHAIYVTPKYRGTKTSDKLMDYLEDYCKKKSVKFIELNVTATLKEAVRFYGRRGFEIKRYSMLKKL